MSHRRPSRFKGDRHIRWQRDAIIRATTIMLEGDGSLRITSGWAHDDGVAVQMFDAPGVGEVPQRAVAYRCSTRSIASCRVFHATSTARCVSPRSALNRASRVPLDEPSPIRSIDELLTGPP